MISVPLEWVVATGVATAVGTVVVGYIVLTVGTVLSSAVRAVKGVIA